MNYNAIIAALGHHGFQISRTMHRLIGPVNQTLDIVPFGPIEIERSVIAWPPDGAVRMSLAGFDEALENALDVLVEESSSLHIPVVSPEGFVLLKLFAWSERGGTRGKADAGDIAHMVANHQHLPEVQRLLYENEHLPMTESYDWDPALAAAHLFGTRTRAIASAGTVQRINGYFRLPERIANRRRLVDDARTRGSNGGETALMNAFLIGFGVPMSD